MQVLLKRYCKNVFTFPYTSHLHSRLVSQSHIRTQGENLMTSVLSNTNPTLKEFKQGTSVKTCTAMITESLGSLDHIQRELSGRRAWIVLINNKLGNNNINSQLDATITNFIDNYNQLNMFRAIISPILRSTRQCLQLVV